MLETQINMGWVLTCTALVVFMQAGFCLLESGLVRSKNSINVAAKNLIDFCFSCILFCVIGAGLMFGASYSGMIGTSGFFPDRSMGPDTLVFLTFQMVFCGTAATIISGAVAERMRLAGYLIVVVVLSILIYPVIGHWAWAGSGMSNQEGWLQKMGFIDFAGSTVVHSVGGWVALAAILVIGPRIGRFSSKISSIPGHNLPMAVTGLLVLWFGWIGFNGGSELTLSNNVPFIIFNTLAAGSAAGATGLALSWIAYRQANVHANINSVIAGLVAITAGCHVVSPTGSLVIGIVAAVLCFSATLALERLKIDDVIGAFPAHAVAGVWGTLSIALFGDPELWGTGLKRSDQLVVQLIGAASCFIWAFGVGFTSFWIINRVCPLRVSAEDEKIGLNVAEHGASTEILDLLSDMELQRASGDFSKQVEVEPHTEVGQIAAQYNRVLNSVVDEIACREKVQAELLDTSRRAGMAEIATGVLHNVGNILNSVNTSTDNIAKHMKHLPVEHLQQAIDLIQKNDSNLAQFFSQDNKGTRLPMFLEQVAKAMAADRDDIIIEIDKLRSRVDHIRHIIDAQQDHGSSTVVLQQVCIKDLIDQVIEINACSFENHDIDINVHIDAPSEFESDRHLMIQMLVNLLSNAKQSLKQSRRKDKRIIVSVKTQTIDNSDSICFFVTDNGIGIPEENLDLIFQHGYTTHEDGHGFGLHSSANAAKSMGGNLSAHSDGPGLGATFRLTLPVNHRHAETTTA